MKLEEAIENIFSTYECDNQDKFPYFLIVGAGISAPEIPLSSTIVSYCKKKCEGNTSFDSWKKESESMDQSEKYSFWLSKAFPEKETRRQFFKKMIVDAKITSSNFQIANILSSKKLFNLVITTNFDNQIEQALNLLNCFDYYTSSNVSSNFSINLRTNDIQIIHVHGDYRNYDLKNLKSELKETALNSNMMSMKDVLDQALKYRSPIIVGYSGWENDIVMTALRERLKYETPYRFYWFCYNKESYESLPEWLKTNNNVCFVCVEGFTSQEEIDFSKTLERIDFKTEVIGVTVLPSNAVFSSFREKFEIGNPELFENPLLPCVNIVNQMSKIEPVYNIKSLLDENKVLLKIHESNKRNTERIINLFNDKQFQEFVHCIKRYLGKKSTLSDSDYKIILNNYVLNIFDKSEVASNLKNDLYRFLFRIPMFRNNEDTRIAAFKALFYMRQNINENDLLVYFRKLYSLYEGTNDINIIVVVQTRFSLVRNVDVDIFEQEYNLTKEFFKGTNKTFFFVGLKFLPEFIILITLQSLKTNNKKILIEFLTVLNNDSFSELRKTQKIQHNLKLSIKSIEEKGVFNDEIFAATKKNFNL